MASFSAVEKESVVDAVVALFRGETLNSSWFSSDTRGVHWRWLFVSRGPRR